MCRWMLALFSMRGQPSHQHQSAGRKIAIKNNIIIITIISSKSSSTNIFIVIIILLIIIINISSNSSRAMSVIVPPLFTISPHPLIIIIVIIIIVVIIIGSRRAFNSIMIFYGNFSFSLTFHPYPSLSPAFSIRSSRNSSRPFNVLIFLWSLLSYPHHPFSIIIDQQGHLV